LLIQNERPMDFKTYDQNSYKQKFALLAIRRIADEDVTSRYSFAPTLSSDQCRQLAFGEPQSEVLGLG
jgi:hypothetical protein